MNAFRRLATVCVVVVGVSWGLDAQADVLPINVELPEISGIARDAAGRVYLASHNSPVIQVLDDAQNPGEPVTVDADVSGIESLSLFDDQLYLGDLGGMRESITVLRVPAESGLQEAESYEFVYPDGAHSSQALAVSGKGRIYVITDGDEPAIYRSTLNLSTSSPNQLTRVRPAPEGVTDAAFLSDGASLLLRTALGVELLDAYSWQPLGITTYINGRDGEAITQYSDGKILVGDQDQLRVEDLPDGTTTHTPEPVASPSPSPSPTPSPSPSASPSADLDNLSDDQVQRGGTITALVAAAVVSVLAAIVVFVSPTSGASDTESSRTKR